MCGHLNGEAPAVDEMPWPDGAMDVCHLLRTLYCLAQEVHE